MQVGYYYYFFIIIIIIMIMIIVIVIFTSESDPHSYVVTWAFTNKALKKPPPGFEPMSYTVCDTSAMLYQLSYEASLEAGQVRVQFMNSWTWPSQLWSNF